MENSKKKKICQNCAFFKQHYLLTEYGFSETAYGHCMAYRLSEKGIVTKTERCKSFSLMREPKEKGLERIEYLIYFLAQKLEELSEDLAVVRKKRK